MSARIKYHLDEHIDPDIAKALLRHGIDVTTTLDAGLRGGTELDPKEVGQRQLHFPGSDN